LITAVVKIKKAKIDKTKKLIGLVLSKKLAIMMIFFNFAQQHLNFYLYLASLANVKTLGHKPKRLS
jgi:hypothetical protein